MWILILNWLLCLAPIPTKSDHLFLIMDDCTMWRKYDLAKKKGHFGFSKDILDYNHIRLTYGWLYPEGKLDTLNRTYNQIISGNHTFSSELTPKDWLELEWNENKKKIFVLTPKDYCSENRFVYNQRFVLYEVIVHFSGNE